jgi:hypothetical protein
LPKRLGELAIEMEQDPERTRARQLRTSGDPAGELGAGHQGDLYDRLVNKYMHQPHAMNLRKRIIVEKSLLVNAGSISLTYTANAVQ